MTHGTFYWYNEFMRFYKTIYSLGLIICLCSCNKTSSNKQNFDFENEFLNLGNQTLVESEEEFNKCIEYMARRKDEALTKVQFTYVNNMGQECKDERDSVDHKLLDDYCEYTYEEDSYYSCFVSHQLYDYGLMKRTYEYDRKSSSIIYSQTNSEGQKSQTYKVVGQKILSEGMSSSTEISIDKGEPLDALLFYSSLADRLLLNRLFGAFYLNEDTTFNSIKDVCCSMFFRVVGEEMTIKLKYNKLFEFDEESKIGEIVPESAGFKDNAENSVPTGCKIIEVTQEFKYTNYLLCYYHYYFNFEGATDSKVLFKRVRWFKLW